MSDKVLYEVREQIAFITLNRPEVHNAQDPQLLALLDECWFVDCEYSTRIVRLLTRHVEHGRTAAEASAWVQHVDEPNAHLIAPTMTRADRVVTSPT